MEKIRYACKTERTILNLYNNGITNPYEIAKITGYKLSTVQTSISLFGERKDRPKHNYKSCKKQTREIIERLKLGESMSQLAKEYGISRQRVHQIKEAWLED